MAKIKADKIDLIEGTTSPHVEDGRRTCYEQEDLDKIKAQENFDCFSYFKIEKFDDESVEDYVICILGIDSNKDPLIGSRDYAALPCPPYCDDDPLINGELQGFNDPLKGTCVRERNIDIC